MEKQVRYHKPRSASCCLSLRDQCKYVQGREGWRAVDFSKMCIFQPFLKLYRQGMHHDKAEYLPLLRIDKGSRCELRCTYVF